MPGMDAEIRLTAFEMPFLESDHYSDSLPILIFFDKLRETHKRMGVIY